jgi:D-3-phosphoglycerate dehydrogenase
MRRIPELHSRITSGEHVRSITALAPGLFGKTVGLIGMGDIAYQTALLFQSFHCRLLIHSPSPATRWTARDETGKYAAIPHERVSLEALLQASDVVSLHCPLNDQTRGMIGEREMARMKEGAVLINTGRGGMVDERALERALKSGKLGGAGLDVFVQEPAYGENLGELGRMSNVICLPHV